MSAPETVVFGAVGDITFHGSIGESMRAHGMDWPTILMKPYLEQADLLFGNMECVVPPPDYPAGRIDKNGLVANLPGEDVAGVLKRAGFDVMNMAANHVLDAGTTGMFHTKKILENAGLIACGIGETQADARRLRIIEKNGIRFGFLCYCEDNNYSLSTTGACHAYYQHDAVIADIAAHRHAVDVLVVSLHADIEFMETPSMPRFKTARAIAEAGADIILMHHPHVPQGIEFHAGCLIVYSLGNFIFDAHSSAYMKDNGPHTAHSFLLLANVEKTGVTSFSRVPFIIGEPPEERPAPAQGTDKAALDAYFQQLDAMLKDDALIQKNWRDTVMKFIRTYMRVIAKSDDPSRMIREIIPKMLFVAENRNVMDEARRMAAEHWTEFVAGDNTYNRPASRL